MQLDKRETICVCVCTYKRPHLLPKLISHLEELVLDDSFDFNVVIVDNDPLQSARQTVTDLQRDCRLSINYFHEERRSISYARNRCIKEAKGEYIAFVDDDEFPTENWLLQLYRMLKQHLADGVLGPVEPFYDDDTPDWLPKSRLLDRDRLRSGDVITNSKYTRTGNVLFRKDIFDRMEEPFDPRFGTIGGGDVEFFERMLKRGKRFIWCDEAVVYENIEEKRRTRNYYIKRALTRGFANSMKYPILSLGTIKSVIAIPVYICVIPPAALFGQHVAIKYLVKFCDHLGKIFGYLGIKLVRERPY